MACSGWSLHPRAVNHRIVTLGDLRLGVTALPNPSHLVRVLTGEDDAYDRMIVATERDAGRELFLQGWIGEPLTRSEWRAAGAALFPDAHVVVFERREGEVVRVVRMTV